MWVTAQTTLILFVTLPSAYSANHFVIEDGNIVQKEIDGDALNRLESFESKYDFLDGIKNRESLPVFVEDFVRPLFDSYGGVDKALEYLRRATRDEPDNPANFIELGNLWRVKGRSTLAVDCFRKCLSLEPRNTDAMLNLASVLIGTGYPQDAERLLRTALELRPASVLHHFVLGNALVARGLPDAAVKSFQRALTLQPGFVMAQNRLIEFIALGWLPPLETNSTIQSGAGRNGSPLPMESSQLLSSQNGLANSNREETWSEQLHQSVASHWLPIVTTLALVLTVMVLAAPMLDPDIPEEQLSPKGSKEHSTKPSKLGSTRHSRR